MTASTWAFFCQCAALRGIGRPSRERLEPHDCIRLHLGDFIYEVVRYPDEVKTRYDRTIYEVTRIPDGHQALRYGRNLRSARLDGRNPCACLVRAPSLERGWHGFR